MSGMLAMAEDTISKNVWVFGLGTDYTLIYVIGNYSDNGAFGDDFDSPVDLFDSDVGGVGQLRAGFSNETCDIILRFVSGASAPFNVSIAVINTGTCPEPPSGSPDTNFTIWNGSAWVDTNYSISEEEIYFYCAADATECAPVNQNSTQSIYQITNNGTVDGTNVQIKVNETFADISFFCDDDNTPTGGTILSTSYQSIHGSLSASSSVDVWCWVNYSNPTSGGTFDIYANVIS